jgi:hypothetical protein
LYILTFLKITESQSISSSLNSAEGLTPASWACVQSNYGGHYYLLQWLEIGRKNPNFGGGEISWRMVMLASTKGSLQTRCQRHDFITFMDHRSSTEKLFLFFFLSSWSSTAFKIKTRQHHFLIQVDGCVLTFVSIFSVRLHSRLVDFEPVWCWYCCCTDIVVADIFFKNIY